MAEVQAAIAGRLYRLACDDGQEEHLLGLARKLDTRMAEMRVRFGELGDQRIAVMAALTFADEAGDAERRAAALAAGLDGTAPPAPDSERVAEALAALSERIDAVVRLLARGPTPDGDRAPAGTVSE